MDSEEPIEDGELPEESSGENPSVNLVERVNEVAEDYLANLRKGHSDNQQELIDQYPELAPELETRLKLFEAVFRATLGSSRVVPDEMSSARLSSDEILSNEIANSSFDQGSDDSFDVQQPEQTDIHRDVTHRIRCPHCGNPVHLVSRENHEVSCGSCGSSVQIQVPDTQAEDVFAMPKFIGRFSIKRLLGQGAFGSVYLAGDPKLDRKVALKVPRRGFFVTDSEEQRFFREAQSAAQLRHENIVRVHEVSEQDNIPFIVCEYIDGLTLGDIASAGMISFREIAEFMVQISNAVEYAHSKGVIHRDLKPGNILVDHDRNAYVTDFGLARRERAGEITMTMDGVILGTPAYMSPEQASGVHDRVDARSDIYSLGVILYRLLCRELPFSGTKRMLLEQVLRDEPKQPRKLNDCIPKDLETITLKTLSKDPARRYQSAGELANELQRWLRGESVRARPVGNLTKLWRWSKRHPTTATLCSAIVMLLAVGTVLAATWATRETQLRSIADQNAEQADLNRLESVGRLDRLLMKSGQTALDENDLTQSAVWFSDALKLNDTKNSRIRIGMIQDRVPTLNRVLTADKNAGEIKFNEDGTRVVAIGNDMIQVFDLLNGQTLLNQKSDWLAAGQSTASLAMSPDGKRAVSCARNNAVQLWDVDNDKRIKSLGHSKTVTTCDIDHTGQWAVTGARDSYVKVWKTADGSERSEIKFADEAIRKVKFIAESSLVVVLSNSLEAAAGTLPLSKVRVWDFVTGKVISLENGFGIEARIVSRGKKILGVFHKDPYEQESPEVVRVWDATTGKMVGEEIDMPYTVSVLFLSQDQNELFTVARTGEVDSWNLSKRTRNRLNVKDINNFRVTMDPSRSIFCSANADGIVRFFWSSHGGEVCTLLRNSDSNAAIRFHPNGRQVAIAGANGVLQIWDLTGSRPTSRIFQHEKFVSDARFTPDGKRCLSIGVDGKGYIWDAETGQQIGAALKHENKISLCDVSADGRLFLTLSMGKVAVWDSFTGAQVGPILVHQTNLRFAEFSSDQKKIVTVDGGGIVTCWGITNSTEKPTPIFVVDSQAGNELFRARFNAAVTLLATADTKYGIRFWDAETGVPRFNPIPGKATDFKFSPDDKHLVWGDSDGIVRVCNIVDGTVEHQLNAGANANITIRGDRILTDSRIGKTRTWRLRGGQYDVESEFEHPTTPMMKFSDIDSKKTMIVTGGGAVNAVELKPRNGATLLWDLNDGSQLAPPLFQAWKTLRVYFSPDGTKILTSGDDAARLFSVVSSDLPIDDLQRVSRLYAQLEDDGSNFMNMSPEKQLSEYGDLSRKYPHLFTCDANEINLWNAYVKRMAKFRQD